MSEVPIGFMVPDVPSRTTGVVCGTVSHMGDVDETGAQYVVEQAYVDRCYASLDEQLATARARLAHVRLEPVGSVQNRLERDIDETRYLSQAATLEAAQTQLCFARIDTEGDQYRIGRIGLHSGREHLLVDWRAPAAAAFYQATWASKMGLVRRRHIVTSGRKVVQLDDDLFDADDSTSDTLVGSAALLGAINAERTGRMKDIISTIAADQDRIIRTDPNVALVVQGGPGTGKTAVALHGAAWLLYTFSEKFSTSGVLIVSPTALFSRYISEVLPSLGETSAVTCTVGDLYSGVHASTHDSLAVSAVKGSPQMVTVLSRLVEAQRPVRDRVDIVLTDGKKLRLTADDLARAYSAAGKAGGTYNSRRVVFLTKLVDMLIEQHLGKVHSEDPEAQADVREELLASKDVRRELNLLWMPRDAQTVLGRLYTDAVLRKTVCEGVLTAQEQRMLGRMLGQEWTVEDVPLLDELGALLGSDERVGRIAAARRKAERVELVKYAKAARSQLGGAAKFFTAETLADRWGGQESASTVAQQASGDPTWTYGHVIVDEAQELSPMAWRSVRRRMRGSSITVVGDVDQGPTVGPSWMERLGSDVSWRVETLNVNYRTGEQMMDLASSMLTCAGVSPQPVRSVRRGQEVSWCETESLSSDVFVSAVSRELSLLGSGKMAVVLPRTAGVYGDVSPAEVAGMLNSEVGEGVCGSGVDCLDFRCAVLTAGQVKGLEFDSVVVVDPAGMARFSPSDLYVATTRPTQRLTVVYSGVLPDGYNHTAYR